MNEEWMIRYTTYNAFSMHAFASTEKKAWEIYNGLKKLAHVTTVETPVQPCNIALNQTLRAG